MSGRWGPLGGVAQIRGWLLLDFPIVPARIGLFGGTFDPPHVGHLVTAVNVRHALQLDVVVLMVANVPWQKESSRRITPAEDRFALVQAAVADVPGLAAGRTEIDLGGPSYTVDTLAILGKASSIKRIDRCVAAHE